jgi:subtilisin family serine protease
MSLGLGLASFSGAEDPLAAITKTLTDAGIAVIVAQSNDANETGEYNKDLYTEEWPSTEPTALSVGAITNTDFPLVYSAVDSAGATLQYASVYPLNFPNGADVLIIDDGCNSDSWNSGLATVQNINETIVAFQANNLCQATAAGSWSSAQVQPVYIMAFNANSTNPYLSQYDTPSQGFFGTAQFINMDASAGAIFSQNYAAGGGYLKYKLKFSSTSFTSVPQPGGGLMDYYSSFGPTWHDYDLKPQISAPGGHVLSTWPLGPLGGYAILSGTSMATPYLAASFALVKSQFPTATVADITNRLQVNASPLPWIYNKDLLSATFQQGAGLVNVYKAIYAESTISPGQLKISDVTKTVYGSASITIENTSAKSKVYTLSHVGAGYSDYYPQYNEPSQEAMYGTASFPTPTVTIGAGQSAKVLFSIAPPENVVASNLPVFGGFIKVSDADGDSFSVPYVGPPYSLYNTPYIYTQPASAGVQLPSVYAFNEDQTQIIYDTDFLEFNASNGFSGSIPTLQWTQEFRLDVLPANTSIKPNHYGFNKTNKYPYIPSVLEPNSTIFGHPSFGTLLNITGYTWPESNSPFAFDTMVTSSNGVNYAVGNGDYRWLASVLRWGGTSGRQEDYDTWLGPVIRFVSG